MDEYQVEIRDLQRTLARLREADADAPLIEEYEAELRNLSAIYQAATDTLCQGKHDLRVRQALSGLGFGDWTLANVYSFVYELSMEIPLSEGRDLAGLVNETDFAGSLLESLDGDEG